MFEHLLESQPGRERSIGQAGMSAVVHLGLIAAAVVLTGKAAGATADPTVAAVSFLTPPPPPPPPAHQPPPVATTTAPRLLGFQAPVPPREIPLSIPAPDLDSHFSPDDYTGLGKAGGHGDGVVGGLPSVEQVVREPTYQSAEVDQPAQLERGVLPRYPAALRLAGIAGTVTLEFVVGTDGKADSTTLRVTGSTDPRFIEAAREAILASSYLPARFRGVAVRQLVLQKVNFAVTP